MKPLAIVIRAAGTNCDAEMCRAFALAGAEPELVHIDALARDPARLAKVQLMGFPGGFSYGDDIASGRILAMRLAEGLWPALREAAVRGVPMIGACNGFQVMVQVGLLPGPAKGQEWPAERPRQTVALAENIAARFVDRWVGVVPEAGSVCLWTKGLTDAFEAQDRTDVMQLPVAHGEGRFTAESAEHLASLERSGQIALRYSDNYNGSEGGIAGICDATGRIFALMPHPERYLDWMRHPYWTRLDERVKKLPTPGMMMFRNAVAAVA
ncbi:MAG: phosphoribosylformylglycinamidine synthase subunit PurQ [Phycisphaerales bacterium]|nr:phosphoribosylformylglycinamidine synthase subunit PurQ [Phycisphaerales bacterium]